MVTKVNELTVDQLKALIDERIEERLVQMIADPDEGLEVREEVIQQLKAQRKARKPRIPMEKVAKKYRFESK